VQGRISKAGDPDVRRALNEAASAMRTLQGQDGAEKLGPEDRQALPHGGGGGGLIMHAMWRAPATGKIACFPVPRLHQSSSAALDPLKAFSHPPFGG
jgi:hypothetical protein